MKIAETNIRVRYQETDNMGVVYYANYFTWFEVARTEYLRSVGITYKQLEDKGMYLMVASASCEYKSPARYDDIVRIQTWMPELKNSSLRFEHRLFIENRLVATGESVHVFTGAEGKPIRVPGELRELYHEVNGSGRQAATLK
ncbi:MAG: acyl-CoA thioesterase [Candidatus Omnitrophica bacterium]|nr:acyl-CoA thioesterase [Candidatus Omnitrophota bacterium]